MEVAGTAMSWEEFETRWEEVPGIFNNKKPFHDLS
jgi:hypothetical protein